MSTSPFKYHAPGMPFMVSDILSQTDADSYYKKSGVHHNSYSSCTPSPSVHSPTYSQETTAAYQLTPPNSSNISPSHLSAYYNQHYYYPAGHDSLYTSAVDHHLYHTQTPQISHNNSSINSSYWYEQSQLDTRLASNIKKIFFYFIKIKCFY